MKELRLWQCEFPILLDDEDFNRLKDLVFQIKQKRGKVLAVFTRTRINGKQSYKSLPNHIFNTEGIIYDHKDRNPLNNQKENLRIANNSQNGFNRKTSFSLYSTSKYKGVYWNKYHKKWEAQIVFNYKKIFLGYFTEEKEAAKAYNQKAIELAQEFAQLNNID